MVAEGEIVLHHAKRKEIVHGGTVQGDIIIIIIINLFEREHVQGKCPHTSKFETSDFN